MKACRYVVIPLTMVLLCLARMASGAGVLVQCPGDANGNAQFDFGETPLRPNVKCMHLTAGDGFATMADGKELYTFGFSDATGMPPTEAIAAGILAANSSGPTIALDEGDEFYLTLTNVGMQNRPDLADPHTVHWHGFPNAATIFDGMPDGSVSINMNASLTYYYNVVHPGTYIYHCHVEATEHLQMGMVANLYVRPKQNQCPGPQNPCPPGHVAGDTYAYNDGDGSTRYDVEYPIQIHAFDPDFHDFSLGVQPLPFALMNDRYATLNGRGYPDTINPDPLPPPIQTGREESSQPVSSLITAAPDQRILLRISNLNVSRFYTLATLGLPMQVVAKDARLLRSTSGENLAYTTNSVTLGGGETVDVLLDTTGVASGTYFLYTTNLNYLSNNVEPFGGLMTEIRIQ